jgi:Fe2+ or Zn2+ uptake regulation protein
MDYKEEVYTLLKAQRVRLTKTRQALLELFFQHDTPLSARVILRELGVVYRAVNKTTVYRELERLHKLGIIGEVALGDRTQYFELLARGHHHHLVCLRCEKVEDVDMDESKLLVEEKKVSRERRFVISRHSLEFFGLCKQCNEISVC